jgi:hypothetical protein
MARKMPFLIYDFIYARGFRTSKIFRTIRQSHNLEIAYTVWWNLPSANIQNGVEVFAPFCVSFLFGKNKITLKNFNAQLTLN